MWSAILISSLKTFIVQGNITIKFPDGNIKQIGQCGKASVVISLLEQNLPKKLILNPDLALGEAYTNGTLVIENDDLFGLLKILANNAKTQHNHWLSKLVKLRQNTFKRFYQRNRILVAKGNVAHHYDLSPELYEMFLDRDRNYSCAYFLSDKDTLEEAQQNKNNILRKSYC